MVRRWIRRLVGRGWRDAATPTDVTAWAPAVSALGNLLHR
jgi:hypothetical protein